MQVTGPDIHKSTLEKEGEKRGGKTRPNLKLFSWTILDPGSKLGPWNKLNNWLGSNYLAYLMILWLLEIINYTEKQWRNIAFPVARWQRKPDWLNEKDSRAWCWKKTDAKDIKPLAPLTDLSTHKQILNKNLFHFCNTLIVWLKIGVSTHKLHTRHATLHTHAHVDTHTHTHKTHTYTHQERTHTHNMHTARTYARTHTQTHKAHQVSRHVFVEWVTRIGNIKNPECHV